MKETIRNMIAQALEASFKSGALEPADTHPSVEVEIPKQSANGDFSSNVAMAMASTQKRPPREIAAILTTHLSDPQGLFDKVEVAGPGFINFYVAPKYWYEVLQSVHTKNEKYGCSQFGKGKRVQVEFVSANPTGPLHVGHGRCAAVGDTLAAVLEAAGYHVEREYYVNDSGRQIHTLGNSVFLRYRQLQGEDVEFPLDAYQGEYIKELAEALASRHGSELLDVPEDVAVERCAAFAAGEILREIKADLNAFNVSFDCWFSEQSLYDSESITQVVEELASRGIIYHHDGALWFRTSDYGDEKDRVVVRANGLTTYFASDIAYHKNKLERGFHRIIDVWGADHHGYIPRVSASIEAMGYEKTKLGFVLVQLVNLLRGGKPVAMSTRAGEFVTLRDVVQEVGKDAARFLFLMRHYDSPLDFDLELAKKESNENPVYYVQYVHARISNILRKARSRGYEEIRWHADFPEQINLPEEIGLIKLMERYPDVVIQSARQREPHRIPFYLKELAGTFHAYYHDRDKHQVVGDNARLSMARLFLVSAIRIIIKNGLTLMGVSAPGRM
jgi:arginyl-tRNA synthetase